MAPRTIAFYEFNVAYDGRAYLPLVAGQLWATAWQDPAIRAAYTWLPVSFAHRPLDQILAAHGDRPIDVAAFSVSLWNEQLSLSVAAHLRRRHPDVLIVFGGCHIPFDARAYLATHRFIDLCARGEGEATFASILRARADGCGYTGIPGLTIRTPMGALVSPDGTGPKDLDTFPSPYLTGFYEPLMAAHPEIGWQAIIETNRGCPYSCAFCYWGNALNQKYRFFSLDRVRQIIAWLAAHRIRYVFNADSNFGMLPNDPQIVEALVASKQATGYPDKFRTCWGKNTTEKVYTLVQRLHGADLDKSLTLSRQSQDPTTLENVHRTNIRLDAYAALQRRANADGVPVYSELIFGMPGETEASWCRGIDEVLQAGCQNQLYLYHCEVLPNTAMAAPAYLAQHGVVTQRVPLQPIHTVVAGPAEVPEYDTIIVATTTMPAEAWVRLTVLNWALQLFHGMKAAFWPLIYQMTWARQSPTAWVQACLDQPGPLLAAERARWEAVARGMQRGEGRAEAVQGVWWEQEEASFLRLAASQTAWMAELLTYGQGEGYRASVALQAALWAPVRGRLAPSVAFSDNLPDRLLHALQGEDPREGAAPTPGTVQVEAPPDFGGDLPAYATAMITRGRKSGATLARWRWVPA